MGIEVRHLRYFVAVAEEGSFTAAARRVHITQQVLSAQMQQLEGGVSLCPASAETFHARPGLAFVPSRGVPRSPLCLAWRAGDTSPAVRRFIKVAIEAAGASGGGARGVD